MFVGSHTMLNVEYALTCKISLNVSRMGDSTICYIFTRSCLILF